MEVKKLQLKLKQKKHFKFRGRFGKRGVRRISNKKWMRWRKARGMDILRKREDGRFVEIGYRTEKQLRNIHPSGYREVVIHNLNELNALAGKNAFAARLSAGIGKRKRIMLLKEAEKLKVAVLNRRMK